MNFYIRILLFVTVILTLAASSFGQTPSAVFTQYCVTCHNARLKTAGLVIDPAEAAHPSTNPAIWEKVVRKLRSASMPPPGSPRPDAAIYDSAATFLETELDRSAAVKPKPGTLPLLHRLTRT